MTTHARTIEASDPALFAGFRWHPLLRVLALWLVAAVAWWALQQQHQLLWARLPASTVERFVADQIQEPLPARARLTSLAVLCEDPASVARWAWWPSRQRSVLADCVSRVLLPPSTPTAAAVALDTALLAQAAQRAHTQLDAQVQASQRWLQAYAQDAPALRAQLQSELRALSNRPVWSSGPTDTRQAVGRDGQDDTAAVRTLRTNLQRLQTHLQQAQPVHVPTAERLAADPAARQDAARLLLGAAGVKLQVDATQIPPKGNLVSDRSSLADALEWQRRGQAYAQRGFSLTRLHAAASALLLGAALVLVVTSLTGQAPWVWMLAGVGLGLGHMLLLDIALTGPAALRYLAERQFVALPWGDSVVPLLAAWPRAWVQTLPLAAPQGIWWPWVAVAATLLALSVVHNGHSLLWAPVRAWVHMGDRAWARMLQLGLLLCMGVVALAGLGMAAAVSEWLVLLACVGAATYWARQAAYANVADGVVSYSAGAVALGLVLACGVSLARGDLGHALMALVVGLVYGLLFGGRWMRLATWCALVLGSMLLGRSVWLGQMQPELAWVVNLLPTHGRERFAALFDPFGGASSDLARVHWLMDSADHAGWGLGYVPWQGLAPASSMQGFPLQGPSDYVYGALVGVVGVGWAVAALGVVSLALLMAAAHAVRISNWPGQSIPVRWLAALGSLGAIVMLAKLLVSVGGVAGWLPLTGLPIALLGYGPVTHAATLVYLALATGLVHVQPPLGPTRGVNRLPPNPHAGHLTRRASTLVAIAAAGTASLLGLTASLQILHAPYPAEHLARRRLATAQWVSAHLEPANTPANVPGSTPAAEVPPTSCTELDAAVRALQAALARTTAQPAGSVATQSLVAAGLARADCATLAHDLNLLVQMDLNKLALPAADQGPRRPTVARADFATPNAYWGVPGCVRWTTAAEPLATAPGRGDPACEPARAGSGYAHLGDGWLRDSLGARLPAITRTPSGHTVLNHRNVPLGTDAALTLDPTLQALATRLVGCYTGQRRGDDCADLLPRDPAWRKRFFEGPAIRAGVMGVTVLDVETGHVLAMAGSISDCSRRALHSPVDRLADGRTPAVRANEPCAQMPDQRHDYLETHSPALWLVPPGSALKPWVFAAGADSGQIAPSEQARWLRVLAESHDQQTVERMALAAQQRWLQVLQQAGLGSETIALLPGTVAPWQAQSFDGYDTLQPSRIDPLLVERIRADVRAGVNADRKYGHATMTQYLAAQALASASIGGGDLRINTLGLAQTWMRLDRMARGSAGQVAHPTLLHTGFDNARHNPPEPHAGKPLSAQAAQRALQATRGVTASRYGGTAQGSCRVVFGSCPGEGVPGLSGKTGTADILLAERSPYLKPGQSLPTRLFGGVFSAQGRRLAVAVMTTRVREPGKDTLEHAPSAAAEAALTLARELGVMK